MPITLVGCDPVRFYGPVHGLREPRLNLTTQVERWHRYWQTAVAAADVERQLTRLYWLQEFAFADGPAIRPEQIRILHEQIEIGEERLAEARRLSAARATTGTAGLGDAMSETLFRKAR